MTVADTGFLAPVWIAAFDTEKKLQRLAVIIDIHKTLIQEFRSLMPGTCVVLQFS